MKTLNNNVWIVDLEDMSCRNVKSNITVQFEKRGKSISGRISYIPDSLLKEWVKYGEYFQMAKKVVAKAQKVFIRASHKRYFPKKVSGLDKRQIS